MTWVISDYTASPGSGEVSVTKGQQVEILDTTTSSHNNAEFCLVRLSPGGGGGDGGTQEGLVPVAVLKPAPATKGLLRRGLDAVTHSDKDHHGGDGNGEFTTHFQFINFNDLSFNT